MKPTLWLACLLILASIGLAETSELNSTDGQSIRVTFDNFDPDRGIVSVRINGQGEVVDFPLARLDEASQERVQRWYQGFSIARRFNFKIERTPVEEKDHQCYTIEVTNRSDIDVEELRLEYVIPATRSRLEQKVDSDGKKIKGQYEEIKTDSLLRGKIPVGPIASYEEKTVQTESFVVRQEQTITKGKGKSAKEVEVQTRNSYAGVLVKVFLGDELVTEIESKHGLREFIAKFEEGSE